MRDKPDDDAPRERIEPEDAPPGLVEQLHDGRGLIDPRPLPGFGTVPIVPGDAFHVEPDRVADPDDATQRDRAADAGRTVDSGEF